MSNDENDSVSTVSQSNRSAGSNDRREKRTARSRGWCLTINNYTPEEVETYNNLSDNESIKYFCYGLEVGECGTPHVQGYIYFHNAVRFSSVKRIFPRAHISAAKGDALQNRIYCSKEGGEFFEWGERPLSQSEKGDAELKRWEEARDAAMNGNIHDIPADIFVRHYSAVRQIMKDHMVTPPDHDDVTGLWIYGEAGAGKSRKAREDYPGAYLKMANKWWDGYQGEDYVILDDLDPNHACLGHHLKIWADRYAFLAEIKGGAMAIRPKLIVVTSQYAPEQVWNDAETVAAIRRRFKVLQLHKLM